jgi:hypothetical protein
MRYHKKTVLPGKNHGTFPTIAGWVFGVGVLACIPGAAYATDMVPKDLGAPGYAPCRHIFRKPAFDAHFNTPHVGAAGEGLKEILTRGIEVKFPGRLS